MGLTSVRKIVKARRLWMFKNPTNDISRFKEHFFLQTVHISRKNVLKAAMNNDGALFNERWKDKGFNDIFSLYF